MERKTEAQRLRAVESFKTAGEFISCEPYGNGHINDTYLVVCKTGSGNKRYILQAVNTDVFKEPEKLMKGDCVFKEKRLRRARDLKPCQNAG